MGHRAGFPWPGVAVITLGIRTTGSHRLTRARCVLRLQAVASIAVARPGRVVTHRIQVNGDVAFRRCKFGVLAAFTFGLRDTGEFHEVGLNIVELHARHDVRHWIWLTNRRPRGRAIVSPLLAETRCLTQLQVCPILAY